MSSDLEVAASAAHVLSLLDEVEHRLETIRRWADELIAREEERRRGNADEGP